MAPLVEILLAVHDGERYLSAQIESIQAQDHTDWRLLISDDGSTDGSNAIARRYADQDSRIVVSSEQQVWGSAERHFRHLLTRSSAEYVMFSDQDDVWLPQKIGLTLAAVIGAEGQSGRKAPVLAFSDMAVVDEDLRVIDPSFMHYSGIDPHNTTVPRLLAQNCVNGSTILMNRELVDLVNRTPMDTFVRMHDRWVALVAASFGRLVYCGQPTVLYRQHSTNVVGAARHPLVSFQGISAYQESVRESIDAARSFHRVYGSDLSADVAGDILAYSQLCESGRVRRIAILLRHRMLKAGLVRPIGQVIITGSLKKDGAN